MFMPPTPFAMPTQPQQHTCILDVTFWAMLLPLRQLQQLLGVHITRIAKCLAPGQRPERKAWPEAGRKEQTWPEAEIHDIHGTIKARAAPNPKI